MTWRKIVTDPTKKYYFTVQNISVIPNSKVYLKIKDADTPPTDTNGAIVLTSKNYLSSVMPTNSYMYIAEEAGGIAGTIVSEVINQTNFDIATVHEDKVLTTVGTVVSIPKGALFVLQNKADNDIHFKISNQTGRGTLVKNQIFAIAFAKDSKVTVSGTAGDTFTYIITASVNMTALDPEIQADIDYIIAHLKTVNSKYITIEALEQVASQLGRGSFSDEFEIRGNNTVEHTFDTVKLNPIDKTVTEIKTRSIINIVGDITFTNTALVKTDKTSFSFILNTNPDDTYSINDIFISNKAVRKHIDKIYIRKSPTKDRLQLVLVTDHNFDSTGKFKIAIDGCKLLKDINSLDQTAIQEEVIYKHDNLEFYSDEDRKEISSNLIEKIDSEVIEKKDFRFDLTQSTNRKIVLMLKDPNAPTNYIKGVSIELDDTNGEIILELNNTLYSNFFPDNIVRVYTIGNKRGLTATFPIQMFSKINSTLTRENSPTSTKIKIKLHEYMYINKSYNFYVDYFKKVYERMKISKDEPVLLNESSIFIVYN